MTDASNGAREVSPELVGALLGFVEVALGRRAVASIPERLAGQVTLEELTASDRWISHAEFEEIVSIAEELTNDHHIGRQVGLTSFRAVLGGPAAVALRSTGSVRDAIVVMADYGSKMSIGRRLEVVDQADHQVTLEAVHDGVEPNQFSCDLISGFFGALPGLFDMLGTAVEPTCRAKGDDRCLFRVGWTPDPSRGEDAAPRRRVRGLSMLEQLQMHHESAAHLVRAESVTDVLDRIVTQVGSSIRAPQFLLSVQLSGDPRRRVHSLGMDPGAAEELAAALAEGEAPPDLVVVPIVLGSSPAGYLAARHPNGMAAAPHEELILASYAGYAASALEIVVALEEARTSRDTATALLGLAGSLAAASDLSSVSAQLARALPSAVGCDLGSVWLFDPDTECMHPAAAFDAHGRSVDTGIDALALDRPSMTEVVRLHQIQLIEVSQLPDPSRVDMERNGLVEAALVPIISRNILYGMVTAGYAARVPTDRRDVIVERIRGMADQASIAFDNAHLAEQMRHQALYDDLTGLPNRSLAEDRCNQALARRSRTGESVAVMFVDLDGFKVVNDSFGHGIGDELLEQVASRMQHQLRATDTCARLGGDEFLLIVSGLESDAGVNEVADRLLGLFIEPFPVDGHPLSITASIGIACAGPDVVTFEQLLQRSDTAMYRAKRAGKNRYAVEP